MASLLIRNVDEALREQLKARARRHRRSVEEEARELLRAAMARDTAGSETLPAIARELAAPMGAIDSLTVVSSDGAGSLSKSVVSQFSEVDALLGATAGFTLSDIVKSTTTGQAAARAVARETADVPTD